MAVVISGDSTVETSQDTRLAPMERELDVYRRDVMAMRETLADLYHAVQDQNWMQITLDPWAYMSGLDFVSADRVNIQLRMRQMARYNPAAKWMVRTCANYVFGTGLTVKIDENAPKLQKIIDLFWYDSVNATTLCTMDAQMERFRDLYVDGNLYFEIQVNKSTGRVRVGTIDSILVNDIVTNPKNRHDVWWYRIQEAQYDYDYSNGAYKQPGQPGGGGNPKYYYLRDWRYDPDDDFTRSNTKPPNADIRDGVVFHIPINREGKFGLSELFAGNDWLTSHRQFMEDRATLLRAWATIAWKVKRKDSPMGIQAMRDSLQSTYVNAPLGTGYEHNPNPAAGATLVENEGSTREPMTVNTGGANAVQDAEMLLQLGAIGGGVFTHYLGSVQAHRLATVSAMELPMLKNFQAWQQRWKFAYLAILNYVIEQAIESGIIDEGDLSGVEPDPTIRPAEGRNRGVDVIFPPILVRDSAGVMNAITALSNSVFPPTVIAKRTLARMSLDMLGVEDADELVETAFEGAEDEMYQMEMQAAKAQIDAAKVRPGRGDTNTAKSNRGDV